KCFGVVLPKLQLEHGWIALRLLVVLAVLQGSWSSPFVVVPICSFSVDLLACAGRLQLQGVLSLGGVHMACWRVMGMRQRSSLVRVRTVSINLPPNMYNYTCCGAATAMPFWSSFASTYRPSTPSTR